MNAHWRELIILQAGSQLGFHLLLLSLKRLTILCHISVKKKKKFGKNSQIEGIIKPKENVLLVEDLMTDGGSKINFIKAILKTGANISAIFVIFNYGINLDYFLINKKKIKIIYLATWREVIDEYVKKKSITKKDRKLIEEFLYSIGVKNLKSYP